MRKKQEREGTDTCVRVMTTPLTGPLPPTMQDTARDKGLWERPLAGGLLHDPEEQEQRSGKRQARVREGDGATNTR